MPAFTRANARPETSHDRARPRQALALPDLRRPLDRGRVERPLPLEPRPRPDRPLGRLRPARPRPATTATTSSPAARSARSACRSATSATCARSSTDPARGDEHLDDDQRHRRLAARALRRRRRGAGRRRGEAPGHRPERHHQGIPLPRHLRLPAGALAQAHRRRRPVLLPRGAEVEPDERLQLPPAGGGRDAGAGARLRPRHRLRGPRRGDGAGFGPRTSPSSSPASPSSSTPASASSPRCARCGPSSISGTRSPRPATA